jgi:hypothetical protein
MIHIHNRYAIKEQIALAWPQLVDQAHQTKPHTRNVFQLMWKGR